MDKHSVNSSFREKLIEHLLIGELLKRSWLEGDCAIEVARPEVDNAGCDIILEFGGVIRHVQLKASKQSAKASRQNIHLALAEKPSGCVVWVFFDEADLQLGPFLFLGGQPGEKLPSLSDCKPARHTKGDSTGYKAERPNLCAVPKSAFQIMKTVEELWAALFVDSTDGCQEDRSLGASPCMAGGL